MFSVPVTRRILSDNWKKLSIYKTQTSKHLNTIFLVDAICQIQMRKILRAPLGSHLAATCEIFTKDKTKYENVRRPQQKKPASDCKVRLPTHLTNQIALLMQVKDTIPTIFKSGPRLHSTLWYCDQALSRQDWEQYCTSQQRRHLSRK